MVIVSAVYIRYIAYKGIIFISFRDINCNDRCETSVRRHCDMIDVRNDKPPVKRSRKTTTLAAIGNQGDLVCL